MFRRRVSVPLARAIETLTLRAEGIGVGAIVRGGILALGGAAIAATGPSALIAFALNGLILLLISYRR